ncbi:MAG: hypothetical protein GX633_09530 [Clostridiales bacterium]|nr:hypothetical protein [Clostridiales bacterium]
MYKAAFFETDITPPIGTIIPGDFASRLSVDILDEIYARAFVLSDGKSYMSTVVVDACGITMDITNRIRQKVSKYTDIKAPELMVIATHTHSGGPTLNWGEQVRRNEEYISNLVDKAADAVICAFNRLSEAMICISRWELEGVGFVRIFNMKGGGLKTNPGMGNPDIISPTGEIDKELIALTVYKENKPVGAVVNYACHPAVVAGVRTSGDFPGALAREMKKKYGDNFITVFINGACGNINHINPFDPETAKPGRHLMMGKMLAEKTIEAVENPDTKVDGKISASESVIKVKIRKPDHDDLMKAKTHLDSLGDDLINSVAGTPGYIDTFFALQAFGIELDKRTLEDIYLNKFSIGDVLTLFGVPCQMFSDYGFRMKSDSRSDYSMVSIFTNDYRGYVPTPDKMKPGVYEARLASTSTLAPEAGDIICEAIAKM